MIENNNYKHDLDSEIDNILDNIKELNDNIKKQKANFSNIFNIKIKDIFNIENIDYDFTEHNFVTKLYTTDCIEMNCIKFEIKHKTNEIIYNFKSKTEIYIKTNETQYQHDNGERSVRIKKINENCYVVIMVSIYSQLPEEEEYNEHFILNSEMYKEFKKYHSQ